MSLLVVGSVAYDSVVTPLGNRDNSLGGSAMYFSMASSYFTDPSIVAVVGDDFAAADAAVMESHGVDTSGLERKRGRTFRWAGAYGDEDVNTRETLDTQLNVFADFSPSLSPEHRRADFLFLANIDPDLQLDVLNQMDARPRLVALDTMNFWIEGKRDALTRVVEAVDVVLMDEGEARSYAQQPNLVSAARRIHDIGPETVIVKRGEHGALMFNGGTPFAAPAIPLAKVVDPTGAGDCFAGGFMGYLGATGDLTDAGFRRAAALGSVMGSFAVESFSADRVASLTREDIEDRFGKFSQLLHLPPLVDGEALPWRSG